MGKPSIFSRDYKKRMKKRRQRTLFLLFLVILFGLSALIYINKDKNLSLDGIKKYFISIINKTINNSNAENNMKINSTPMATLSPSPSPNSTVTSEKKYSLKLTNGSDLDIISEIKDGNYKFTNVTGPSESLNYDISPSGNGIIVYDTLAQSIIYVSIDGKITDITKKAYVSSTGSQFIKEDILKTVPGYTWVVEPKFINEENVAYLSSLPWFNQDNKKYLWIVNVKNPEDNRLFENVNGTAISLGKLDNKGLNITIDGIANHINSNGELTDK